MVFGRVSRQEHSIEKVHPKKIQLPDSIFCVEEHAIKKVFSETTTLPMGYDFLSDFNPGYTITNS